MADGARFHLVDPGASPPLLQTSVLVQRLRLLRVRRAPGQTVLYRIVKPTLLQLKTSLLSTLANR